MFFMTMNYSDWVQWFAPSSSTGPSSNIPTYCIPLPACKEMQNPTEEMIVFNRRPQRFAAVVYVIQ